MWVDEPRVTDACGALDGRIVVGGHPDGRTRLLHRADVHVHVVEPAIFAFEADGVLGPQPLHELDAFFEARDALALGYTESIELYVTVAEPDAEDEVALGEDVQCCHGLRDVHRVMQVREQDAESGRHFAGLGHQACQKRHELELLIVALVEIMLPGEQ